MKPKISMIACITGKARSIGVGGKLLFRSKEDMRWFQKCTLGKPIIMGRRTYESIGGPLPGRSNIVLSRNKNYRAPGCITVHSVPEALEAGALTASALGADEIMIIGGDRVYHDFFLHADYVYLTDIKSKKQGDAFFPAYARRFPYVHTGYGIKFVEKYRGKVYKREGSIVIRGREKHKTP